ncbi:tyrosine--tRNA ligase [Chitinispirillales bacterium ANBcel5]|uniref:tyrosine--tRNA ligase n=1 Tax=Cellulosispirillum alkaliphilum TaxID=3039283 RepID=UPI002A58A294|nr:tyrosine--tRNA ligase [Chitinispirillales bacterium ANBcel5]
MNFIEELRWRGMIHDITPGAEEKLLEGMCVGYAGFDPTGKSLHIGHLIPIMLLMHFQRCGHKPLALVGGATGMIGDPSGKSQERNLLTLEEIADNQGRIKKQLEKFLDFSQDSNNAEIVNNYDWLKDITFLDFLRDVGKHLSVNYMMSKDSVKSRYDQGISFTEFSYQLLQAYDFYWLYKNKNCSIQMGGSDQWGNITSGTELVRRKGGGESFALTCPLLTRSDGKKFGKSEGGESVWLDPQMTSPYKFFQYWMNCTDEDAPKLLRIFTLLSKEQIEDLEQRHSEAPHERIMQKALAEDVTIRVHSESDYRMAVEASQILFGKGTSEALLKLSEQDFLSIFEGVPQAQVSRDALSNGVALLELLAEKSSMFSSKGEARRLIAQGGVQMNKEKITDSNLKVDTSRLISDKYILFQKGKKSFYIIKAA